VDEVTLADSVTVTLESSKPELSLESWAFLTVDEETVDVFSFRSYCWLLLAE
jgi:hypothetical protein